MILHVELVSSKCILILLYGLGCRQPSKTDLLLLNFTFILNLIFFLSQANQRLHLLSQLQHQGLCGDALKILFTSLILSKLLYAITASAGQLSADDRNRYDALGRKAVKRGLITDGFNIIDLIDFQDGQLFTQMLNDCHCLHHLLPPKTDT